MSHQGGPGTGSLGGPPSGHNYKRAVYRPSPKEFTVDVLPPTKMGSGFCFGMRICPIFTEETDVRSTRSGSSHSEYEVWRRWEDCLWFQEILESEYALMARQKRTRLQAGKGVKKNGVYVHSDQAASFDSLPPGPDANTIAKDIHEHIPRLTKKGTLFRPSQATIDQRGREFKELIEAMWRDDIPSLIQELRETRLVRDFFGYWRRDLDHDRKRQSATGRDRTSARHSVASSAFSMYFSASNISLQLPTPYADLPPSPALPNPQSPLSQEFRRNSVQRDESRRRSSGAPPSNYATSDSSASTVSVASLARDAPGSPQDMTFYVSTRGSLALSVAHDEDLDARAEYINAPLSAPARVQPPHPWARDSDRPYSSSDDEIYPPDTGKPRVDPLGPVPGEFHPGLEALPEDGEFEQELNVPLTVSPHDVIEEVPCTPVPRRSRNNSCPDKSNRQCLIFPQDDPRSAQPGARFTARAEPQMDTRTYSNTSSSSTSGRSSHAAFSSFAGDSRRSSWRTSMMSETSGAPSFATSFANGSCANFERGPSRLSFATSFAGSSDGRATALGHRHRGSMATLSSFLSDLSIDSNAFNRGLTPSPSNGTLRRSLSAGSRRPASSIMATLDRQEDWYEQQEDLLDAYFYDPGMHANQGQALARTPSPRARDPTLQPLPFHKEVSSPDRYPKPFRDRPPGQFHLPWTPPTTPGQNTRALPSASPTSPAPEGSVTLKAVLHESIVLLRVARGAPLADVRQRLRDKFAAQEGVTLAPTFVVGWAPAPAPGAASLRGRPRSNSASSVGALPPHALRYVYSDAEWAVAVAACQGGKMTIRLFNAQPL
ncbi:uncharacterized protein BXZ73DRAFT_86653 [Epithele typhae]|uniref:uncharacterized protein n=1 Tax=Epithele typhae TaxID=378194 RepID=UPI002007DBF3|nr:uncharacterized protein BXZ73DRAFT_86653 [Epithele typhae]KAH9945082.1 hypothetical protein BXZ73DRAFT_86653 [Epithele typhae]